MWYSRGVPEATPPVETRDVGTQTDPPMGSDWFPLIVICLSALLVVGVLP